jgi:hypothetical protein
MWHTRVAVYWVAVPEALQQLSPVLTAAGCHPSSSLPPCRLCSHVGVYYHPETPTKLKTLFAAPVPYEQKKDGIAFVNSNCGALSGRTQIVQNMMDTKKFPVNSYGGCLRNMEVCGGECTLLLLVVGTACAWLHLVEHASCSTRCRR